jgi:tight adherence protein C
MAEYLLLALVFLFFAGLSFVGYMALSRRRERVEARLVPNSPSDPAMGSTPELVLGDLTEALAAQIPMTESGRSDLQRDLLSAGMYRHTAMMEYTAIRAVLTITPLVAAGAIALFFTETTPAAVRVWIGGAIVAGLGFSLPRLFIYLKGRARKHAIERGLPTAIDMITLCLSAGLNVLHSIERVSDELSVAYPELGFELQLVRRQADLRSLEFALIQFADRVDIPQLRNISVILNQSEKLGTDGVTVLREYSDNLRIYLKQHAEALANRAPLKLLLPAYMLGIGFFILLLTPPAMEVAAFRRDNVIGNAKEEGKQALDEVNRIRAGGLNAGQAAEETQP